MLDSKNLKAKPFVVQKMENIKTYLGSSIIFIILTLTCSSILFGCENDNPEPVMVEFKNIEITGNQQVPFNSSSATGIFNGAYNKTTKNLKYSLTFTGIIPTGLSFHKGSIGINGDLVLMTFNSPYTSPINNFTQSLTDEQETDLLSGLWYVNIQSAAFPQGELRGQLD